MQPDEPVILDHLGDLYSAKADLAKAGDFYRRAVQFAQKDKDLQKKVSTKLVALQQKTRLPSNDGAESGAGSAKVDKDADKVEKVQN